MGPVCVKRALPRLKVAADWRRRWNATPMNCLDARGGAIEPDAVPEILAEDVVAACSSCASSIRRPSVVEGAVKGGNTDPATAEAVARRLVGIHASTAGNADIAACFATDSIFHSIRLEPYLLATARAHPDLAAVLAGLAESTAATRKALVHGDVSPKNILVGPRGPVFLDAECAWYGDPAFDLAFCLNHLLLKCLWTPAATVGFLLSFEVLAAAYLQGVRWEPPDGLERRAARLLPGLFLARVDGKSPVEYVSGEEAKNRVRRVARALLADLPERLQTVREAWSREASA